MPTNDPRPSKAARREDARAKALALRQEQERKAKRTRLIAIAGLVTAVAVLGGVVFGIVRQGQATRVAYEDTAFGGGADLVVAPALADVEVPAVADETGGVPVSSAGVGEAGDDDVVLTVYFDFMCPWCGKFDAANSAELVALAADEGVTVVYKSIAFLDRNSQNTFYSTRSANAAAVVADEDPEHYVDFVTALFENQPEEGTKGLTDTEIGDIALGVGVPQDVVDRFTVTVDGTFEVATNDDGTETETREGTWRTFAPFVAAATQQTATELGGLSTPTVLIDGEKWEGDLYTTGPLTQAVLDAVAAKG